MLTFRFRILMLGLLLGGPAVRAATLAFVDVNVVSMRGPRADAHQTVLVRDGLIAAVGPVARVAVPAGALRIDGRGRYLMPGLTDTHVHLMARAELPLFLAQGVTTVYNLSGHPAHLAWRREVALGQLAGPRILTTGPIMNTARTPAEAARAVEAIAAAGYDGIKVYNHVGAAEYDTLTATARRHGLLLMGHVARAPGFAATLAAGQSLAHEEEILYSAFNREANERFDTIVLDADRIPAVVRQIADAGIFVTATLSTFHDIEEQASSLDGYLQRAELAWLAPWVRAGLAPGANIYGHFSAADLGFLHAAYPFQQRLLKAMDEAGVPLMTGTDAAMLGPVAGYALHRELDEFVRAGLSPYAALRAATVNPAAYFHEGARAGTVEAGKRADLLLLDADPLLSVDHTRRIAGVVANGRWLPRAELDRLQAAVPAAHAATRARLLRVLAHDPQAASAALAEEDPLDVMSQDLRAGLRQTLGPDGAARALARLRAADPANPVAAVKDPP